MLPGGKVGPWTLRQDNNVLIQAAKVSRRVDYHDFYSIWLTFGCPGKKILVLWTWGKFQGVMVSASLPVIYLSYWVLSQEQYRALWLSRVWVVLIFYCYSSIHYSLICIVDYSKTSKNMLYCLFIHYFIMIIVNLVPTAVFTFCVAFRVILGRSKKIVSSRIYQLI